MTMLFSNNQLEKSFTKFKVINLLECKKYTEKIWMPENTKPAL